MADDSYSKTLESLQQYIPFLDNMIAQLKDPTKKNREQQLNKMQSLHAMITDKRKKLKLETLIKCEDVISKLYEKVHNKPIGLKKGSENISSTPASPSPPRETIASQPLTIPTERLEENRFPKIDIYSSAGESLSKQWQQANTALGTKVPDMTKPPISLEDLKTLEDDVHEKINESTLKKASLNELNSLREKLTEQIHMEEVLMKSPQKNKSDDLDCINTTVRNNLSLTKKVIQPPDKCKSKDSSKSNSNKRVDSNPSTSLSKKELKSPSATGGKPLIVLKEPESIFGSILSHIDDQIREGKKKKEERRSSLTGRDDKDVKKKDRKHSSSSDTNDERKDSKDTKEKEKTSNLIDDKHKSKDEKKSKDNKESEMKKKERHHHKNGDTCKVKDDDQSPSSEDILRSPTFSLTGKQTFEVEEEKLKKNLQNKETIDEGNENTTESHVEGNGDTVCKITAKKDIGILKSNIVDEKEDLIKPVTFKRLADKYNPKPRKSTIELDVDKEVSDIIEEKMKTTPPKLPLINQIPAPIPPPASLIMCSQMEPEMPEPAPKLPPVIQSILTPSTTELINNVVNQLRQNNAEAENKPKPLLSVQIPENFVSEYAREDNFVSEYSREDFTKDDFPHNNLQINDFTNFQTPQLRHDRLNYEPPTASVVNNQFNPSSQSQRFVPQLSGDGFNENFTPNRSFTPIPQGFTPQYSNFQANPSNPADLQPLDYYPPNAPVPSNQYNCGPPLLSPEIPHFHNEQKPANFGMMPNHEMFGHNEDMRWRQEERFHWDRRDQDLRLSRDPRTYREYREMRESREPRVTNRDPRENRDTRDPRAIRDPRVNRDLRENRDSRDRDPRERDPRLNRDREFDHERSRFGDGRSQSRDSRPSRYDSKFDRMYSRTNRDRSRSRSYSKETFTSPLDSLYSEKEKHKTGKGYGVQHFRIPKIKKEEEDQSTKVSSTNEDVCEAPTPAVNDGTIDSTPTEVADTDKVVTAEQTEEVDNNEVVEQETEKCVDEKEVETKQEPPKLISDVEETKEPETPIPTLALPIQMAEQDQAKSADQTILAQFFANLLGSQNKKDKKTALYSLISTFSDTFSEKELTKITKIIKADDEAESSEEEEAKKPDTEIQTTGTEEAVEPTKEPEKEADVEESHPDDSPIKMKRKTKKRIRRISSTHSLKDENTEEEIKDVAKTSEERSESLNMEEESVVVSVGERIKSRKRMSVSPPKPKKRCKTELDMLHEDIQEMFIRDGVLTASGKRMCRILKTDPSALTTPQAVAADEPQKVRKKPGPKPKPKLNSDMKSVKNIRILLSKIPDKNLEQIEEPPKRNLRNSTKTSYAESDDEDKSAPADDDSVVGESLRGDGSDAESSDTEKDKTSQVADNKTKVKRKRGKGWASGNIPSNKRRKKKQLFSEDLVPGQADITDTSVLSEADKSFVEPDKNYYIDCVTNKSHECKICDYKGRFITTHYKIQHPESEVLTSRFSPAVALEAIEDSKKNLIKYENALIHHGSGKFHYTCRFCAFNTTVPPTIFYDHITTHTGEYRHICPLCNFSASSGKTLKSHMSNIHNNVDKRVARKSYSQTVLFAYMCGECNYVQLNEKHVEDHINIFHLQKPKIYKVNMSTTLDPEVVRLSEMESKKNVVSDKLATVEDENSSDDQPLVPKKQKKKQEPAMSPPQTLKFNRPGPKSVKERLKAKREKALEKMNKGDNSDTSSVAESETGSSTEPEQGVTPTQSLTKSATGKKKRAPKEVTVSAEEIVVGAGRSRRAAKDKATEKLKSLMEVTETGYKKKSNSVTDDDEDKNKKENVESKKNKAQVTAKSQEEKLQEKEFPLETELPKIKKEIDLNVFTCKTDIQEENKKIEQERLQLMEELNKSVGSRTSLNFVDKLCNRLSNNDVIVKQEPRDDFTESVFPSDTQSTSLAMPVLEKSLPTPSEAAAIKVTPIQTHTKKPVLEAADIRVSNSNFDVTQKNDKLITDMIQKLKGKLANIPDDKSESSMTMEDMDYDSEGPPPLTHANELPNISPADGSREVLLIGGFLKVIKYPNSLFFSCLVPPCVYTTNDKEAFQKHCSEGHRHQSVSTLCEICGVEIGYTQGSTLLANIFKHALEEHSDFDNDTKFEEKEDFIKPPATLLRIRKLSGDALSIKKDWDEEIDQVSNVSGKNETEDTDKDIEASTVSEVAVNDTSLSEEPAPTMAELDINDDNPFPFKISGVMSLAEPVPPLAPLAPVVKTMPNSQLIVKEAKLSPSEMVMQRKTSKAMAKFVVSVSDLYKCPHYYCLFSTNFREFLERHLKAHKLEKDVMIPCVYCDMKTPWEHVPMHIDIRHAHCRYACSYCLYRAVVKEYVFLHQDQIHPASDYSVIALPQHKHAKRWAIADVKIDPRTLCEPYKCTPYCGLEFLFENEFRRHLQQMHKSNFIPCGYENCSHRVQANKMPNHWALSHAVSVYQCGNCKMNSLDMMKMYQHYAFYHQGMVPDILIRKNVKSQEGVNLGYTQEAFKLLRKVISIPNNIVGENKVEMSAVEPYTVPVIMSSKANSTLVATNVNRQVVIPPSITKGVLIPINKSIITTAINIANANATTSSANNVLFFPSVTSAGTSPTNTRTITIPAQSNIQNVSVASVDQITPVSGISNVVVTPIVQPTTIQTDNSQDLDQTGAKKDDRDTNLSIAPLEHITLTEENSQSIEETEAYEADPLSLDADIDLNDPSKSAADSSGDESDGNKLEKSKNGEKNGLLSYQLYRCAFCDISFSNSIDFKRHATYSLTCRKDEPCAKQFLCVHCTKQIRNPQALVDHIQCHGVLRFACSLCGCKFPTSAQTRNHMKQRHNINQTFTTALSSGKQNIDTDEYVVRPKLTLQNRTGKETSLAETSESASSIENIYTPETVDQIPMRHILSCSIKCGICQYTTKVRTNMVRHLQFHSQEKAVSDIAPVNPVPCLEKNEKMFDKMVNLASSSHANSRMGGNKSDSKEKEADKCPEFVPSHCRYVCCAHGCSYMCPEEGNLRHHLIALHDSETSFTCVHCKMDLSPTDADNLIKHFKLHSLQLYKCQYCPFIHNLKHKVEKHVSDTHLDLPLKVITVRFMESEPKDSIQDASNSNSQVTPAPTTSGKAYKPWRCCMCKYKNVTEKAVQTHVLEKHEIDSQFKCALCSYKTNDTETFADHFKVTHDNQTIDIIYVYRKVEEDKEKESEIFDTTPLWQRDRPRVRHIRGILFDETTPTIAKSPRKVKPGVATASSSASSQVVVLPQISNVMTVTSPSSANEMRGPTPPPGPSGVKSVGQPLTIAGIKSVKPSATSSNLDLSIESVANGTAGILQNSESGGVSDDFFHTVNKLMKSANEDIAKLKDSAVIIIDDEDDPKTPIAKNKDNKNSPVAKNRHLKRKNSSLDAAGSSKVLKISEEIIDLDSHDIEAEQNELSERSLKVTYGGLGAPLWRQFKCPICNMFKSKRISDFVFHLYKEMKVFRFKCKMCAEESITYRYMHKHVKDHKLDGPSKDYIHLLPPEERLLTWLQMVIRDQSMTITHNYPKMPQVATSGSNLVQCNFCSDHFQTEQEKNEHSVIHWINKPYRCSSCVFTAYTRGEVENHFKTTHEQNFSKVTESEVVVANGPTVEILLNISDEQHRRETQEGEKESPQEVAVPAGNIQDPLDTPVSLICEEQMDAKTDDSILTENDLIIVTKTDTNVPTERDIFCCEYCPFMANSEVHMISHITAFHPHMSINFKKIDRVRCEDPKEHVGCTLCPEIGSEIKIRQHFVEKHDGETFNIFSFQCSLCSSQKRFLKFQGLKIHFNRVHVGQRIQFTSLYDNNSPGSGLKTYRCPQCSYVRNLKPTTLGNMRQHIKQHFKAFKCGLCAPSLKYKTRADVISHCNREHGGKGEHDIKQDRAQLELCSRTMAQIIASAVDVPVESTAKSTARKSTSAAHTSNPIAEYSFYGTQPEEVDKSKIMTSVEINGMHLNMSAEKLSKLFDLNVSVALEDCNLAVNQSSGLDS